MATEQQNQDFAGARDTFVAECSELLASIENTLLALKKGAAQTTALEDLFRCFHTIKGSAGMFGFDAIVTFTHEIESYLDARRGAGANPGPEIIHTLLECGDHIASLLSAGPVPVNEQKRRQGLALLAVLSGKESPPATTGTGERWMIRIVPDSRLFQNGLDPLSFLRHLETKGKIHDVMVRTDDLPALEDMDAEACYLSFQVDFEGAAGFSETELREVFEFLENDAKVEMRSLAVASLAAGGANTPEEPAARDRRSVRVEAGRLDQLVDLVGELMIATAQVSGQVGSGASAVLEENLQALSRIVSEVRDVAMTLRMVPLIGLFRRLERLVHDLARETGKPVELVTFGAQTELDRTMIERLVGPMTHMFRNAIDHGIESETERSAAGKSVPARLTLTARQEGGEIVIDLADDGRGFNLTAILNRAVERGLIGASGRTLSEREILEFVFAPGFSTAATVTELSGRGVGLDVVRREIESLRGNVTIESRPGLGSTLRIRLPLTLASIDGFLVRAGDSRFVLPLEAVEECLELADEAVRISGKGLVTVREEALALLDLNELFSLATPARRRNIVVVQYAGRRLALVVDELLGEIESVIKAPGPILREIRGLGGFTILGDGHVALILDLAEFVRAIEAQNEREVSGVTV